jgi:hypothetical protein
MEIISRIVKVWDVHAFCAFCGKRVVLSMVNDPEVSPEVLDRIFDLTPACSTHRPLLRNGIDDSPQPAWSDYEDYEEFLRATHE